MLILGAFFFSSPFQNAFVSFFFNLCTYLFMFGCVVLIAVHGFSLVVASRGCSLGAMHRLRIAVASLVEYKL